MPVGHVAIFWLRFSSHLWNFGKHVFRKYDLFAFFEDFFALSRSDSQILLKLLQDENTKSKAVKCLERNDSQL